MLKANNYIILILVVLLLIGSGIGIYFWLKPTPPPAFICGDGICSQEEQSQSLCPQDCQKGITLKPCPTDYKPVCGKNNVTYQSLCSLERADGELAYEGECKKIKPTPATASPSPTGAVGPQDYQCPGCSASQSHTWEIKSNHTLYYDNQPYIPYVTLASITYMTPAQEHIEEYKIRYALVPKNINEFWFWVGGRYSQQDSISMYNFFDQLTDVVIQDGGTYSIQVMPTEYLHDSTVQNAISNKAPFYVRAVVDITKYAGQTATIPAQTVSFAKTKLDLTGIVYEKKFLEDYLETTGISFQNEVEVYLADLQSSTYQQLSQSVIASSSYDDSKAQITINFNQITFPTSTNLKLVLLPSVYATTIRAPGDALSLSYASGVLEAERGFYKEFANAVAKEQLRAVNLYNEINGVENNFCFFPSTICRVETLGVQYPIEFPDFSDDMINYKNWLNSKYNSISAFNSAMGTNYANFNEVKWFKPIVFDKTKLLGEFASETQTLAFEELQREYFTYKLGKGIADVAKVVKEEWGNIPVCVSAASSDDIDIEEAAIEAGVDGFCAHYYSVDIANFQARTDFDNALNILNKQSSNKFYWVTEFNKTPVGDTPDPTAFARFDSKTEMDNFMKHLTNKGLKGFLFFELIGAPPAGTAKTVWGELWGWYAELKDEIINAAKK